MSSSPSPLSVATNDTTVTDRPYPGKVWQLVAAVDLVRIYSGHPIEHRSGK